MSVSSIKRRFPRIDRRVWRVLLIGIALWLILDCIIAAVVYTYGLTDRAQHEDVIIVLGGGLNHNLTPTNATARRAQHAADLWKAGYAPMIICTGGYPTWASKSEAEGCADTLDASGVPKEAILLEQKSRSTEENALYAHAIMRANGWKTALVVSDGYHLLRATWLFSNEGIPGSTSPAASPPLGELVTALVREVVAFHWQVFKTVLNLPVTYVPWW